jgi:serpin B
MHRGPGLIAIVLATILFGTAPQSARSSSGVDVASADNAFGFRLLNAVQKSVPNANVVLSPVSAALNLSMVLAGAKGQTRQEILAALSLADTDINSLDRANEQLIKLLRTPTKSVDLSVADSLWVDQRRVTLRPDYAKRVKAAYDAQVTELDFSDPNAARQVNLWADQQTHGKIPKVIDRIDPRDLLLLLNAVYFKGEWAHKFDKSKTQQRDFTPEGGSAKQVPRMEQGGRFDYFETAQLQAIRLPFGAGDLVLQVFLPAKSSNLGALETQLTPAHWREWQGQYASRPGTIELPRFELKSNYHLNEPLQSLGM